MNPLKRLSYKMTDTRLGTQISMRFSAVIDQALMRLTKGRMFTTLSIGVPSVLLITTGAKSGKLRRSAMLCFEDGDTLIVIASNGGDERHPSWYYNLKANPQVQTLYRGRAEDRLAHEAEPPERDRLWQLAMSIYPMFDKYQARAGTRRIPVIVLTLMQA